MGYITTNRDGYILVKIQQLREYLEVNITKNYECTWTDTGGGGGVTPLTWESIVTSYQSIVPGDFWFTE